VQNDFQDQRDVKPILDEMMRCPYSLQYLSRNGRQPDDPGMRGSHDDGCGMAFSKNGSMEVHRRDRNNAWDESYRQLAETVSTNVFIAHNRLASKGLEVNENGAHPFSITVKGKTFALCHNGGIKNYMEEAKQMNTSDSFIFLQKLISTTNENDSESIFKRLSSIAKETSYSSLCAYLITGNELYVWRIYSEQDPGKKESYEKYYTLYMVMRSNAVLFSSEPLDEEPWMLLENNSFIHIQRKEKELKIGYRRI
jgi:predicted glutamine amidotransferase